MAPQKDPGRKPSAKPSPPAAAPVACPLCADQALQARAREMLQISGDPTVAQALGVPLDVFRTHFSAHASPLADSPTSTTPVIQTGEDIRKQLENVRQEAMGGVDASLGSTDITRRLGMYLDLTEGILAGIAVGDHKLKLLALDQARKNCETIAKLHLDIMRAQLDVQVQAEFRQIVMEAINDTAPAVRQRILDQIQSRARTLGVLGYDGGPGRQAREE
jgi:hypothetical protein